MSPRHREPVRTCAACRREGAKQELRRFVRDGQEVVADPSGRAPGRGAYLHADPECARLARRRRVLERALGGSVGARAWDDIITNSPK
ncbi:MAG: YlxR family protein [Candidatus Dormibacteraceae bacterium]